MYINIGDTSFGVDGYPERLPSMYNVVGLQRKQKKVNTIISTLLKTNTTLISFKNN
jgi:hypothetical protein